MKYFFVSLFLGAAIVGILLGASLSSQEAELPAGGNVRQEGEGQVITITAKGGYTPSTTTAAADVPTVLEVRTSGTFDCSAALVIPSLSYRKMLPPSGTTTIQVPPQPSGSTLQGVCSMGMYSFDIQFL